jgi:ribosome-associated translation inhibitor RaiA
MRLTISAPALTKPTYQTLEEYATKRFSKLKKILRKKGQTDHEIRIGVEKSGDLFELVAEVFVPVVVTVRVKNRDLRAAIDEASDQMRRRLREGHEKVVDQKKKRNRIFKQLRSMTGNFWGGSGDMENPE